MKYAILVLAAVGSFFLGRLSSQKHTPAASGESTRGMPTREEARPADAVQTGTAVSPAQTTAQSEVARPTTATATPAAAPCPEELAALRARHESMVTANREAEGTPIDAPKEVPERFSQSQLVSAVSHAFKQSRIPGRLETIDCSEYPCIVYGRIFGDEDHLERLERAKALSVYEHDILTLLSWGATDESARKSGDTRPERLLFAMAVYPREHRATFGDNLDRRVRVRTADLWNALRPDDED